MGTHPGPRPPALARLRRGRPDGPAPRDVGYSAAKFGLRGVSEVLRFDLRQYGIGVTLVCPGAVDTPLVGTVNIVGVDRDSPVIARNIGTFQRHAVSPDSAAASMIRGVERGRHLVFTPNDIRVGWNAQRYAPWIYHAVMRRLNRKVTAMLTKARAIQGA